MQAKEFAIGTTLPSYCWLVLTRNRNGFVAARSRATVGKRYTRTRFGVPSGLRGRSLFVFSLPPNHHHHILQQQFACSFNDSSLFSSHIRSDRRHTLAIRLDTPASPFNYSIKSATRSTIFTRIPSATESIIICGPLRALPINAPSSPPIERHYTTLRDTELIIPLRKTSSGLRFRQPLS
jgi:hypothetical protein